MRVNAPKLAQSPTTDMYTSHLKRKGQKPSHHSTRVIRIELSHAMNPPGPSRKRDQRRGPDTTPPRLHSSITPLELFPSSLFRVQSLWRGCIRSPQRLFQGESPRATHLLFVLVARTHAQRPRRVPRAQTGRPTQKGRACRELRKFLMPDLRPLARRALAGCSRPASVRWDAR